MKKGIAVLLLSLTAAALTAAPLKFDFTADVFNGTKKLQGFYQGKLFVIADAKDAAAKKLLPLAPGGNPDLHRAYLGLVRRTPSYVKISFILDKVPETRQALFSYVESSWGERALALYLTPGGELRYIFNNRDKENPKSSDVVSGEVELTAGKKHTVVLSCLPGGKIVLWFDGEPAAEAAAGTFADFVIPHAKGYPFFTLGFSWMEKNQQTRLLEGSIVEFELGYSKYNPKK